MTKPTNVQVLTAREMLAQLRFRQATATLARQEAKRRVRQHIRAQGWKIWDFTSADLTLWAEVWLREHPEMFAQAKVRAVELGFAPGELNARNSQRPDQALPPPNRNAGMAPSGQAHEARSARASLPHFAPR
jgi:hypothetical protein